MNWNNLGFLNCVHVFSVYDSFFYILLFTFIIKKIISTLLCTFFIKLIDFFCSIEYKKCDNI